MTHARVAFTCEVMAAAVLPLGVLVQSPRPNTLGYLTCCNVCLFTSIQPPAPAMPDCAMKAGADMGGTTWRRSYFSVVCAPVALFLNVAV